MHSANEVIANLLPPYVAVAEGVIADGQADLWPEEAAYVANAVEKRRREFACGRHFARRCFRALGRPDGPLPANPDRSPRWPDGLVGSITHTDTYCAAAVARADDIAGIGIDVEDDAFDDMAGAFHDVEATVDEGQRAVGQEGVADGGLRAARVESLSVGEVQTTRHGAIQIAAARRFRTRALW